MTRAWNTAGASTPITPTPWDSSWPAFVPTPQRDSILGYFQARYGIPLATFASYDLFERRRMYLLLSRSAHLGQIASLKVHQVGLPLLRKIRQHLKPTTAALQHFGHLATQNVVDLPPALRLALFQSEVLLWSTALQPGYVILRSEGYILGCGLYTPGQLRSQIPRRYLQHQRLSILRK